MNTQETCMPQSEWQHTPTRILANFFLGLYVAAFSQKRSGTVSQSFRVGQQRAFKRTLALYFRHGSAHGPTCTATVY